MPWTNKNHYLPVTDTSKLIIELETVCNFSENKYVTKFLHWLSSFWSNSGKIKGGGGGGNVDIPHVDNLHKKWYINECIWAN